MSRFYCIGQTHCADEGNGQCDYCAWRSAPLDNEFSVAQFLADGSYEYVRRHVSIDEAMKAATHYMGNVASKIGITKRVIVTDGSDHICFEWINGSGVTFPPKKKEQRRERDNVPKHEQKSRMRAKSRLPEGD
jgi:hypothetical protein